MKWILDQYHELYEVLSPIEYTLTYGSRPEKMRIKENDFSQFESELRNFDVGTRYLANLQIEHLCVSDEDRKEFLSCDEMYIAPRIKDTKVWLEAVQKYLQPIVAPKDGPWPPYVPSQLMQEFFRGPMGDVGRSLPDSRPEAHELMRSCFTLFIERCRSYSKADLLSLAIEMEQIPTGWVELQPFTRRTSWDFPGISDYSEWLKRLRESLVQLAETL